jgi:2-polyprenyl-3-methyl-5-hydroxy-6-metoxy-1,4-benzoquinol methylase
MNISKIFKSRIKNEGPLSLQSEEDFYTDLFTRDQYWSKPTPNSDEATRWQIIENFIYFIKGSNDNHAIKPLSILDLGCGRGWLTNLLSKHGDVKGVEPIKPVVEHANKIFPKLDITHGTAKDILGISPGTKFDLIVSSEVIEHVPDSQKKYFVEDIKALLNDNGFAIITTPRKEAESEWRRYAVPGQPVEEWMTEEDVKVLFETAGFNEKLLERFSIPPGEKAPLVEIYQLWLFKK